MTLDVLRSPTAEERALRFRRATGRLPAGVTVVTAQDGATRVGMTVATLTPASDEPPMLLFLTAATSASGRAIIDTGAFAVNVLARGQEAVCQRFARSGVDKFTDAETASTPAGLPMLPGCVLNADCALESAVSAGDHILVLGRVTWYDVPAGSAMPLVFYRSRLSRLDSASGRHIPTEPLHWW